MLSLDFAGPIVLYMNDFSGYGNVSLAVKITRFLIKKYPSAIIYIIANPNSLKKIHDIIPDFLDKAAYPNVVLMNNKQEVSDFDSVQLEIETAICQKASSQSKLKNCYPKIFIGEYRNYRKSLSDTSVINISDGILIEEDLLPFNQLTTKEKNRARIQIITAMKDLQLKIQILAHKKEDMIDFINNNNFAFAYYNYPISFRRAAIIFAASNKKKHANYFVSLAEDNDKDNLVYQVLHDEYFIGTLKKLGYQKVIFYDKKSTKSIDYILLDSTKIRGKEFRVFQRARFSQELTLDLMRLSELCGVAGNQSLTEAISLGIVPIPEENQSQFNLIDQIAKNYYEQTVMGKIYSRTWRKQRKTDLHFWIEAGEIIRDQKEEVKIILTKIQKESNLYSTLENRLNLAIDSL